MIPLVWSSSAAVTLTRDDLKNWHHINATGNFDLTLPTAAEDDWTGFVNYGSSVITVKNPAGTTIGTLRQYQSVYIPSWPDSGAIASWPAKVFVQGSSGATYPEANIVFRANDKGPVLIDTADAKRYRLGVTSGSLTLTDLGAAEPADVEPPL
jgi:hypothetical protein